MLMLYSTALWLMIVAWKGENAYAVPGKHLFSPAVFRCCYVSPDEREKTNVDVSYMWQTGRVLSTYYWWVRHSLKITRRNVMCSEQPHLIIIYRFPTSCIILLWHIFFLVQCELSIVKVKFSTCWIVLPALSNDICYQASWLLAC